MLLLAPHLALRGQKEAVDDGRGGSELLGMTPWMWEGAILYSLHSAKCNIPVQSLGNSRFLWAVKAGQSRPRTLHLFRKLNVSSGWERYPFSTDFPWVIGLSCIQVPRLWCPSEITKDWRQQRRGAPSPFIKEISLCALPVSPSEAWIPKLDPLQLHLYFPSGLPALERQRFPGLPALGEEGPSSKTPFAFSVSAALCTV